MKLLLKIVCVFILSISLSITISIIAANSIINKSIKKEAELQITRNFDGFISEWEIQNKRLKVKAENIANIKEIKKLLIKKKTHALSEFFKELYSSADYDIVELEDENGDVLVRGHNPNESGDSKKNQKLIRTALDGFSDVDFADGKTGFALRAVAPVRYNDKIYGIVMLGKLLSLDLALNQKKITGIDMVVRFENSVYSSTPDFSKNNINNFSANIYPQIKAIKIGTSDYLYSSKNFYDKNMHCFASILFAKKINEEMNYVNYLKKLLILSLIIAFMLSTIIFAYFTKKIKNSVTSIKNIMQNFIEGKEMERFAFETGDEFSDIGKGLNKMLDWIQNANNKITEMQDLMIKSAKLTAIGQLTTGIAHEIRNPLNTIKMMIQMLHERIDLNLGDQEKISIILKEIERLEIILKEMLEFAKPSILNKYKVNLNELLANTVILLEEQLDSQKIKIQTDFQLNTEITIDPEKIKQVVINLILNALDAIENCNGIITIKTGERNNEYFFSVRDNGAGIAENNIKNIFEPFFTTKNAGTGLGLAIVKTIIDRHNGRIEITSDSNGSEFIIYLPEQQC